MKIIEAWKVLNAFQGKHWYIAALVWLSALMVPTIVFFPLQWADIPLLAIVIIGIAYALLIKLSRYESALSKRIDAGDEAVTWQVLVNGVTASTLSDAAYAAIRRRVFFDAHTYVDQLLNFGNVLSRVVNSLFLTIPIAVFWCGLACFFLAPDTFASILAELQKVTPAQIVSSGVPTGILRMLVVISISMIAVSIMMGKSFGFINRFDQASNEAIRRAIGCAAEGDVFLFRFVDGKMIVAGDYAPATAVAVSAAPNKV